MKRKIAAIMAADVAQYSRLVAEDEEETLRRFAAYREVFDDFVRRYGGRIFNTAGDSVMSEFDSAVEATRAAIDIQESLRTRNMAFPKSRRVEFRIGITIGDVVERGGDLLGDGVNIAARLEGLAEAGGICVSRSVHEAVAGKVSVPFRDIGVREVKNLQPVHAFAVAWPGSQPPTVRPVAPQRPPGKPKSRRVLVAAAIVALAVAAPVVYRSVERTVEPPMPPPAPTTTPAPKPPVPTPPPRPAPTPPERAALPADPAAAYAALAKGDSLVPNAKTAAELYHNARLLEARGDALGARRAYLQLAALGRDFVDPHLRFSALLRVQDGRAGAREVYGELQASHPAKAVALTHALQFEGAERRSRLEAFVAGNPDFAPAQYLLAEAYAEDGDARTLTARRLEFEALDQFLDAGTDGRLAAYFLDSSMLAQWLDRSRRGQEAIEAFFKTAATRPTASFTRSNGGWTASLVMPEPATAISYRVGEAGEFRSTGLAPANGAGKPAAAATFELPADQQKAAIYISYEDASGRAAGPFVVDFDPRPALAAGQRAILEVTSDSWLSFDRGQGSLLTFAHLVAYRCAIERAVVGFDGGPLDTELPLPPCDEAKPAVPADMRPAIFMPDAAETVSVQLTYADGTTSEVKTLKVP